MGKKGWFLFVMIILCFGILFSIGCAKDANQEEKEESKTEDVAYNLKPVVYVEDVLWETYGPVSEEILTKEYKYIGNIESSVPYDEMPEKNFQANRGLEGAEIYRYQDKIIVVYNKIYELYTLVK